ncbi:MAG: 2-hydroxyacyl-CoA dehydratase, partial [Candidatus Cloacimonadota bacterium]|nr:2-hydroxyacyl-CoA dehydratase [Candidatus Cloacimonadota bacterium]
MKVGYTTTIPVEIILAAGHIPVDLNNIFVTNNSVQYVEDAEMFGYPRNSCAWIKGMHAVAMQSDIDLIVGIVQGDCSNTHSLMEILKNNGKEVYPFSFSYSKNYEETKQQIYQMEKFFNVKHSAVLKMKKKLDKIRKKLVYLDKLTWNENIVTGFENHYYLVNSSDFLGNPDYFEKELDSFLKKAEKRNPIDFKFRMGFVGVPPIIQNLYEVFENLGIHIVFNEVQRQFSMPQLEKDFIQQYLSYTYPYDVNFRIKDIQKEIEKRNIDGVISYTQAFCHRQIEEIIIKEKLDYPVITLEGDQPTDMDARTKRRLE